MIWNKPEKQPPLDVEFLGEIVEQCRFWGAGCNVRSFLSFSHSHKGVAPRETHYPGPPGPKENGPSTERLDDLGE